MVYKLSQEMQIRILQLTINDLENAFNIDKKCTSRLLKTNIDIVKKLEDI